ncbi:MAG TPA: hypothetical protein VMM38_15480 [Aridibacter sp.]|nr:hypothetical protein [Aridibacter sp.]
MNLFSLGTRILGLLIAAGLPAFYSASFVSSEPASPPVRALPPVTVVRDHSILKSPAGEEVTKPSVQSLPNGRVLLQYEKTDDGGTKGRFFRISRDGSKTFSPEENVNEIGGSKEEVTGTGIVLLERGLAATRVSDANIYIRVRADHDSRWTPPVRINDQLGTLVAALSVKHTPGGDLYSVWIDNRKGFPLTYFSRSEDGGRSWSPNAPVEFDFREGNQANPRLVIGAGGRVLVFWEDWRDRRTLVDIRYAYSDDGGRHWTAGGRINDDDAFVWQIDLSVASSGSRIYVAFSDFRDPGEVGDNDWNIYYAVSENNGTTFGSNRRLNDVTDGIDKNPSLAVDPDGRIFCAWRTGRRTIFGDIAVSYSPDGGNSWAPSSILTADSDSREIPVVYISVLDRQTLVASWREDSHGRTIYRHATISTVRGDRPLTPLRNGRPVRTPLTISTGQPLYSEDFSDPATRWDRSEGVWLNVEGSLMGVAAGKPGYFVAFAPVAEPESYVLEGRFKLDPVSHFLANIYLRADPAGRRHYVIANRFRSGSWISLKDDDVPLGTSLIGGDLLDQERFPFQRDRWYSFRIAVTPAQIDYFVDGRLMLSARTPDGLSPDWFGIGGQHSSPSYFDDIKLYPLER